MRNKKQSKRTGYDLMFVICSQRCAMALKEKLQKETDIIDLVLGAT
jgi:hypothetical protein